MEKDNSVGSWSEFRGTIPFSVGPVDDVNDQPTPTPSLDVEGGNHINSFKTPVFQLVTGKITEDLDDALLNRQEAVEVFNPGWNGGLCCPGLSHTFRFTRRL